MATSRETIEIVLSGLDRITELRNRLVALSEVAGSVEASIGNIGERVRALGAEARTFGANTRVLRRTAAIARATADNPATGTGLPAREAGSLRQRIREMGQAIDRQVASREQNARDLLGEINVFRRQNRRLIAARERFNARTVAAAEEQAQIVSALQSQRRDILAGARETGARARRRGTSTLIERRRAQAQRLRSGPDLLSNLVPVANEIDRRLEFTESRLRELDRASRVLARSVRAANPGAGPREIRGIVERERRIIDSQRRAIATEQGRLIEQRKELNRNDAGRRAQFDQRRRLNERIDVLQRAGGLGLASRAARLPESTRADIRRRFAQASDLAAAGNLEAAKAIYAVIEKTISAKERQLRLDQQITRDNEKASAAGVARERQRQTALTQERRNLRIIEAQQRNLAELTGQGAAGLPSFQRFQAATQRLPQLQQAGDYDEFARTLVDAAAYGRFTRDELKARNRITKSTNKYEGEINKTAADILAGKKVERSQVDKLLKFNELRAGGVPQRLALPPAAPGSAAFTASPEVVNARLGLRGTESVIGGVAQPRMIERLGGTRTSDDALKALPEKAKAAGTKAGQQAGQTFAKAFAEATPLGVSDKLLSEVSGFFKKLPTTLGKSLSAGGGTQSSQVAQTFQKAFAEATDFETPGSLLADLGKVFGKLPSIIGNAAKANKNYEEGLKKTATAVEQLAVKTEILENLNAGVYDDSDLEKLVNNFYESERAASAYLEKLSSTYKLEDERRKANERGASKSEQRLDRENSQMLAIEKRQRKLAELQAAGVTGPAIQRAQSLVEKLPGLAAQGAGGAREFSRIDKQAAQALGFATPAAAKRGSVKGAFALPTDAPKQLEELLSKAEAKQLSLLGLQKKGADIGDTAVKLERLINEAKADGYEISLKGLKALEDQITAAANLERVERKRVQLANSVGAGKTGKAFDPQAAQQRLNRILSSGETISGQLDLLARKRSGLDPENAKRVEVESTLKSLQGSLNAAKQEGFKLTKDTLDALDSQLNTARALLSAEADANKLKKEGLLVAKRTGEGRLPSLQRDTLTSGLIELGRADTAAKVFRGGRSGEQALSDAIGALKAATGPQKRGPRVTQKGLPIGAAAAAETGAAGQGVAGFASRLAEAGKNAAKSFSDKLRGGTSQAKAAGTAIGEAAASGTKESLDIASPSGVYEKFAKDVIAGFRNGILAGKGLIQSALDTVFGNPKSYRDAVSLGLKDALAAPATDVGEKVGAFVARSTTRPSVFRKLVGIVGDSILSSPAVTEATYRRAYEKGNIVPPIYQPVETRRLMRAENRVPAGVPGSNLESIIMDAAMAKVRASGSLVGPISGPQIAAGGASSSLNPGILFSSAGRLRAKAPQRLAGSSLAPIFDTESPVQLSIEALEAASKDATKAKGVLQRKVEGFFGEINSGLRFAGDFLGQAGLGSTSKPSRVAGRSSGPFANIRSGFNFAQESLLQAGFSGINLGVPKQQAVPSSKIAGVFSEIRSGLAFAREFLSQAGASGLFGGAGASAPTQAIGAARSSARSIAASVAANAISVNAAAISNIAESTKKAGIDLPLSEQRISVGGTQVARRRNMIDRRMVSATPPGTEWMSSGTFLGKPLIPSSILAPYVPPSASLERGAATRQREIAALEATDSDISSGENNLKNAVKCLFGRISGSIASAGGGGGSRPGGPTPPSGPSPDDLEGRIEGARGNAQKLLGLADLADLSGASNKQLQLFAAALAETRDGLRATDAAFNSINKVIGKTEDVLARRDPNADLLVRAFGQRGGQAVGEGLIGGAFPLLFGQGGGAALGGGVGGALGGFAGGTLGFGLSLAGTAIGSQVDALAQAAQDTGNLLRELSSDVSGSFEKIKESGLLASRSQEKLIGSLLEAGNKTAAYAIIQDELNRKLGSGGAEQLRAAADAGDRLNRAMADLGTQMQIFISGPLTALLNKMAEAVERGNLESALQRELGPGGKASPEAKAIAQAQLNAAEAAGGGFGNIGKILGQAITGETKGSLFANVDKKELQSILTGLLGSVPAAPQTGAEKRQETIRNAETRRSLAQTELDIATKANEPAEILKGFKQQATAIRREQQDIDRQSFELRRDYERQIEDIRRNIEDRINQIRQENQQRELEILVKQGQIREQQFKNASTALQGALAGDPLAQSLADAVTTYLGAQLSAQDQIEQRRKQFEIEISNQQLETEKFKLEVGRTLSRLNTDTAEKVAEINRGIARRNEDAALNNFDIEKKIAKLRISVTNEDLRVTKATDEGLIASASESLKTPGISANQKQFLEQEISNRRARIQEIDEALKDEEKRKQAIDRLQAPPRLSQVTGPATRSVSFAGVNQGIARAGQLREQLKRLEKELLDLVKGGNLELFAKQLGEIAFGSFFELNNSLRNAKQEAASASGDVSASIQAVTDSYSEFFALAQQTGVNIDEPTRKFIKEIRDGQIAFEKIKPSMEFYASNLQDITAQTKQSRAAIDELLLPTNAYDKVLAQINARDGLGINPEEEQLLLKNARALDEINAKLKVLEGLRDIASGWTDSFIQLNKELLKGGNLLESVQRFAESVADRTLDVVLEFTLRPIQERLFKNMTDILGIKAPEDPALQPIRETAANTKILADKAKKEFAGKTGVPLPQPVAAQAPANGIVPGPSAARFPGGAIANRVRDRDAEATGWDIVMPGGRGAPVRAPIPLTITGTGFQGSGAGPTGRGYGNWLTGEFELDGKKYELLLGHFDRIDVAKGMQVPAGAQLGLQGITGRTFGPHATTHVNPMSGATVGDAWNALEKLTKVWETGVPLRGKSPPAGQSTIMRRLVPPGTAIPMKPGDAGYDQPGSFGTPAPIQQVPFVEPQPESPVAPAANQAAESLGNLDQKARQAADGITQVGTQMSDSVSKFQQIVGTGLQAITSVAMGIGGAQMIRKGGAYNTLMGAASIFGSISSITGMFGTGGALSGLFGGRGGIAPGRVARAAGVVQRPGFMGPAFANGGRPSPGDTILVGENGPELVAFDRPGVVVSNDDLDELYVPGLDDKGSSSAPPIGRYARRSNASSDMADGDSERSVYGDTYQRGSSSTTYIGNYGRTVPYQRSETSREIDRLERVTSSPSELPPIKYETTRVNEYDFVTPEQLEASNARTAKVARNQTIRELADSLKTRKRLGL